LPRYKKPILAIAALLTFALVAVNRLAAPHATASPPLTPLAAYAIGTRVSPAPKTIANIEGASAMRPVLGTEDLRELARKDPAALARLARERCERELRDYTCLFLKRERVNGKLGDLEEIEVRDRNDPLSVYMIWKRNASQARRVLFQDTAQFLNDRGEKLARVEPAGALIRLIVSDILMPIHGERARQTSRRSIDEFGFKSTLALLERYNGLGAERGVLDYRYQGEGEIDGRPTFVFVRHLPYDGPNGPYPDAKMVMHLDQEWLLPTAVYSYADHEGKVLLGSYVHKHVRLNPGLGPETFRF
jgi:hypothetical protein